MKNQEGERFFDLLVVANDIAVRRLCNRGSDSKEETEKKLSVLICVHPWFSFFIKGSGSVKANHPFEGKPLLGSKQQHLLVCLLLVLAVAFVYRETLSHDFLLYHDDDDYVTDNPNVSEGLSLKNIGWAFTCSHAANWHPFTWISHQMDVELYGTNPAGHHATNLVLHALNAVLLFFLFCRMTGHVLRSAIVAALFAVHPLHVESVAWVAERKDLLCTFFMMLCFGAYLRYARAPGMWRYLCVVILFLAGLLSKPMLVTLPFVLLLLDYWPLQRSGPKKLVLEKLPLIAISAASCLVTVIVQKQGGAMQDFPLVERISNAAAAYVKYMMNTLWPNDLSALYPHPEGSLPVVHAAGAAVIMGAATFLVIRFRRSCPFLPFGWFFFLGTLVPVIGLVQVGNQAMADRYTYIPLIGLFVMAAWGVPGKIRVPRDALIIAVGLLLLALTLVARGQVKHWKDSATLFRHAIDVTGDNYLAEHDLGMALVLSGQPREGLKHLNRSVRIKPGFAVAYVNLAMIHCALKNYDKAWEYVRLSREHGYEPPESFISNLISVSKPAKE